MIPYEQEIDIQHITILDDSRIKQFMVTQLADWIVTGQFTDKSTCSQSSRWNVWFSWVDYTICTLSICPVIIHRNHRQTNSQSVKSRA